MPIALVFYYSLAQLHVFFCVSQLCYVQNSCSLKYFFEDLVYLKGQYSCHHIMIFFLTLQKNTWSLHLIIPFIYIVVVMFLFHQS